MCLSINFELVFRHTRNRGEPLVRNRWLILAVLFLARTAMGFQFQSVAALSPFLVTELGIDYIRLGLLISSYLLPGIVIAYPGGFLGQRFGDKRAAVLGLMLMTCGGVLTSTGHGYAPLLVGRLIGGIGGVLSNVFLTKMATDWFVGREIGTALALLVSSWPLGCRGSYIDARVWQTGGCLRPRSGQSLTSSEHRDAGTVCCQIFLLTVTAINGRLLHLS